MLVHYFSDRRPAMPKELFYKNVADGYLVADQYAAFQDFAAGRNKKGKQPKAEYFNSWHHDPDTTHLPKINERRVALGMNTFEQQERNKLTMRERRKNKIGNTTILLE